MAFFRNGTESMILDKQCAECLITGFCPVLWVQSDYNYKQIDNEMLREAINQLVNDITGECQMKKAIDDAKEG